MKKKNSAIVTVVVTLVIIALAAFIAIQPYMNSTPYTTDENIAAFLGSTFGKYPRLVNEKDFEKVELLEIGTSQGYQYISLCFDGFIEKRDEYLDAYEKASEDGTTLPETPDLSQYIGAYQTDGSVSEFVDIKNFKNLREVSIMTDAYSVSSNLEEFKDTANLETLLISGSTQEGVVKVSDISVLSDKTSLIDISITYGEISDISALSNLTKLETVELSYNNITDISALGGKDITTLALIGNNITDISALSSMPKLETVTVDENEITDISVLNNNETISTISLSSNKIVDIAPVATMKKAYIVSLYDNEIVDVAPLAALADVTEQMFISLDQNDGITDWSPLDVLPDNIMIDGRPEESTDETVDEITISDADTTEDTTNE